MSAYVSIARIFRSELICLRQESRDSGCLVRVGGNRGSANPGLATKRHQAFRDLPVEKWILKAGIQPRPNFVGMARFRSQRNGGGSLFVHSGPSSRQQATVAGRGTGPSASSRRARRTASSRRCSKGFASKTLCSLPSKPFFARPISSSFWKSRANSLAWNWLHGFHCIYGARCRTSV